jgi:hypothetical protein
MMHGGVCYPLANSARHIGVTGSGSAQNYATPTATANQLAPSMIAKHKSCAAWLPTPTASDSRNRGNPEDECIQRRKEKGKTIELSMTVSGQLNPTWVEWLMGWPPDWTSLKSSCIMDFLIWEVLNGRKNMPELWWTIDPSQVEEWEIRLNAQEQEILLNRMLHFIQAQVAATDSQCRTTKSTKSVPVNEMFLRRRWDSATPFRWESAEQFAREYQNIVSKMPCCRPCGDGDMGAQKTTTKKNLHCVWDCIFTAEGEGQTMQKQVVLKRVGPHISRTTLGQISRSDRLRAIGNGQVPIVAATAWQILTQSAVTTSAPTMPATTPTTTPVSTDHTE